MTIPTAAGDLYQTTNTAKNVVLRPAPAGAFTITTKLNHKGTAQYQQGGIIVYGDDDNYIKLDRTSTNTAAATTKTEFVEFVQEVAAVARNAAADHTANLAAAYAPDMWLRIVYNGTNLIGQYSPDGTTWTNAGQASTALPANAKIGFFALSNAATTTVNAVFDWWQVEGPNAPAIPGCVSAPNANPVISSATRTPTGDVTTGTAINFAAAATDADGDTLTYAWDFGDTTTSAQQNPTKTYTTPGTYAAKVTVSDGKGGTATQTLNVVVTQGNRAPTVTAARTPTGTVAPGTELAFTATGADLDGDTLTYAWDFGDTTTSTQQNPTKTYPNAGTYAAKVTVSDGKGGNRGGHGHRGRRRRQPQPDGHRRAHAHGQHARRRADRLHGDRDRPRRRPAHVRVGLRRHDVLDAAEPDEVVPDRRDLHGPGHGLRRQGRHGHHHAQRGRRRPIATRRSRPRRRPRATASPRSRRRSRPRPRTPTATRSPTAGTSTATGRSRPRRRTRRSPTPWARSTPRCCASPTPSAARSPAR